MIPKISDQTTDGTWRGYLGMYQAGERAHNFACPRAARRAAPPHRRDAHRPGPPGQATAVSPRGAAALTLASAACAEPLRAGASNIRGISSGARRAALRRGRGGKGTTAYSVAPWRRAGKRNCLDRPPDIAPWLLRRLNRSPGFRQARKASAKLPPCCPQCHSRPAPRLHRACTIVTSCVLLLGGFYSPGFLLLNAVVVCLAL